MTAQLCICYGRPDDPAAFDEYYRTTQRHWRRRFPDCGG
ncbi:hypothetical protein Rrhod_2532 [Rhodococcus rhodnii LMG 5362]|uniref:Uncharacterized protein n=1 Tax=Rhodococcus rhodnii LMG 5362 TaxID=1273125 RepID=R7WLG7_9NOCA|nr:hypothetical protein Rrhod_2532 [Rhodococcus rhodnii LMG 5362]